MNPQNEATTSFRNLARETNYGGSWEPPDH